MPAEGLREINDSKDGKQSREAFQPAASGKLLLLSGGHNIIEPAFSLGGNARMMQVKAMSRIIVIGSPGAGKSTFARRLRDISGLPLYYLDMIYHRSDMTTVSREEFDEKLERILETERWIIDGNYRRTLQLRLEKCTDVFLFDLPAEVCLKGACERVGKIREDMPWTEDRLDPEFRQYILDFPKDQLPEIYEMTERYRGSVSVTVFHARDEADEWIEKQGSLTEERSH